MLQQFADIIRYPKLTTFFDRFSSFVDRNYNDIISFYSGKLNVIKKDTVTQIDELIKEYDTITELIEINKNRLSSNISAWDILETIDEIGVKIQTIKNTPKWLRSSIDIGFSNYQVVDGFLKNNQNLEGLAEQLGSTNKNQDWTNIAVYNQMFEEDYTHEGDKPLKLRVQYLVGTTPVNSVDIMIGENVLGKDLHRDILFSEEDLLSLLPIDTMNQSAEIMLNVFRGGIEEYPNLGVDKTQISSNINSLQYPSLFRQLTEMFRQDDSFKEIQLIDTSLEQDAFFMKFSIISRSGISTEQVFKIFDDTYDETFN